MAILKYSKQRESIQDYLNHTKNHPTADMVYMHVKNEFPNISLGTVYRNLNLLAKIGEVTKITTPEGGDRFDADNSPHYHFICTDCGAVQDLQWDSIDEVNKIANEHFDGHISSHHTTFFGTCKNCGDVEKKK